jgi:hypothetical protein
MRGIIAIVLSLASTLAGIGLLDAQVVQLPSYHVFSWSGTVSVPDQGTGTAASVNQSSSGSNEFGGFLLRNSSMGSARSAAGVAVSAQIHDFPAMEADLEQAAARAHGDGSLSAAARQTGNSRTRAAADQPLPSLADIRRQQAAAVAARQDEALELFRRGERAQADGKPTVAGVYYRMAARQATGQLAQQVRAAEQSLREPAIARR